MSTVEQRDVEVVRQAVEGGPMPERNSGAHRVRVVPLAADGSRGGFGWLRI